MLSSFAEGRVYSVFEAETRGKDFKGDYERHEGPIFVLILFSSLYHKNYYFRTL